MKIVIQCAASKSAPTPWTNDAGQPVLFVANPHKAPPSGNCVYARPDDLAVGGRTWRELLVDYNKPTENNSRNLGCAGTLYSHPVYAQLLRQYGADDVFILSAGWGLISAKFLTPDYDITFSNMKPGEKYKQRGKRDYYHDLCQLPTDTNDDLIFFGGKSYLPLFCKLTRSYRGCRYVFYNSDTKPDTPGCKLVRYPTRTRTNWHYSCVRDFMDGEVYI